MDSLVTPLSRQSSGCRSFEEMESIGGVERQSGVTATIQETMTGNEQKKQLLVLKLREKCVKWDESAVNNEFMGKKSSKRKNSFISQHL